MNAYCVQYECAVGLYACYTANTEIEVRAGARVQQYAQSQMCVKRMLLLVLR